MATQSDNTYNASNTLSLWFKIQANDRYTLTDIPELISYRWQYFRDNWDKLRANYDKMVASSANPDLLATNILNFTEFVNIQRSLMGKNPFTNSNILYRFYAIFENTFIDTISLTAEEQTILNNKINKISAFTRSDFVKLRESFISARDAIADNTATSDYTYDDIFGRSPQVAQVNINNKYINQMYHLQNSIKTVNYILANIFSLSNSYVDPFALARSNANNPDVNIGNYTSGNLVKLNYGEDLRGLAARTLGSADLWIDIAIANGLKAPYIDEFGEAIYLISNANGNQINISGTDVNGNLNIDKLYVNQIVILQSSTQVFQEQRTISNIKSVPVSGEIVIELDGDANLQRYSTADNAHIRIYKPNTVNSMLYILIPSGDQLPSDVKMDTPWFLQKNSQSEKLQKIDVSLDGNNDLSFSSSNDFNLSYALDNAVQAIKIKLQTEQGELERHGDYGLVTITGSGNMDITTLKSTISSSIVENVQSDSRFDGITRLDVEYIENNGVMVFNIIMEVKLAGSDQQIPISFSVNI